MEKCESSSSITFCVLFVRYCVGWELMHLIWNINHFAQSCVIKSFYLPIDDVSPQLELYVK